MFFNMSLAGICFLLVCTVGVTFACMTSTICKGFFDEGQAKATLGDIDGYCQLQSKTIACYAGDTAGCPNREEALEPLYTGYYNVCSLTAVDVTACAARIMPGCVPLRDAAESSLSTSVESYCSGFDSYTACLTALLPNCDQSKVTVYDVLGQDFGRNQMTCDPKQAKFNDCQTKMYSAACQTYLVDIANLATSQNFSVVCRSIEDFITCTNLTFYGQCDQSLNVSHFMSGMEEQHSVYCKDTAAQCQLLVHSACYSIVAQIGNLTTQTTEWCGIVNNYLTCVNTTMQNCDSSLNEENVIGQIRASYLFQCGPGGPTSCPAISICMQKMTPSDGQSATPNILQECGKIGDLMRCMDTEFNKCNVPSHRPYTFADLADLYVTICRELANNTALLTCPEMTTCMSTLPIPTDPAEIMKLYNDPEFWCSLLKMAVGCARTVPSACQGDPAVLSLVLDRTNQMCFPGDVETTSPGDVETTSPGDVETTSPASNELTSPVSKAGKTRAEYLLYVGLTSVVLFRQF